MDIDDNRRETMLDNVARSDAFFKSQQKDEPDLTFLEKRGIAESVLERNKTLFLQRFHNVLHLDDLRFFDDVKHDYEIDYYMNEVVKMNDRKINSTRIKNRRYEALQRLIKSGDYFADNEMKTRDPLLYEQMIGCHLTEKEKQELQPADNSLTFSSFLLSTIEREHENRTLKMRVDEEEGAFEENDSDEESLEDNHRNSNPVHISGEEKIMLRQEFTNIMYERFLSGRDDYDYSSVDHNTEYDSWQLRQQDEEEKYFDAEDQ